MGPVCYAEVEGAGGVSYRPFHTGGASGIDWAVTTDIPCLVRLLINLPKAAALLPKAA
jgi:hypothetical protein